MSHPLTDEMCKKIQLHIFNQNDEDCMRAAWDLGFQTCIDWLLDYPYKGMSIEWLCKQLKKELRPQQEDNC